MIGLDFAAVVFSATLELNFWNIKAQLYLRLNSKAIREKM